MNNDETLYPQLDPVPESNNNAQVYDENETNEEETSINNIPAVCILGCGKQLILREMKTHLVTECENVEVTCPQLCGKKVARKNINEHLDHFCGNTKPCMLAEFGCSYVARGVDCNERVNEHLKEKVVDHITLLTSIIKTHEAKLNQPKPCQQKIKAVKSKLDELKKLCPSVPVCQKLKPYSELFTILGFFLLSMIFQTLVRSSGLGCFIRMFIYGVLLSLALKFCRRTQMSKKVAFGVLFTSFVLCSFSGFCDTPSTPKNIPLHYSPRPVPTPTPQINIQTTQIHQSFVPSEKPVCNKSQQPKTPATNDWFGRPQQQHQQTQTQQQPATFRLFKPCMLEASKNKRANSPVFTNHRGQFMVGKQAAAGRLLGYISEKYFHGSAPVYVYQDAQRNVFYTVDYIPEDQFPQYSRLGKLGYVDADRLTCKQ